MQVVIGLDAGTTATKAVAAGVDGVVRAVASRGYPLHTPSPGLAELDAHDLTRAAVDTLAEVSRQVRAGGDEVAAVCFSAAMHGLVPLDADGAPLGRLATWGDSRGAEQATALVAAGRHTGLHARTGTPVHAMSPLVKLMWWAEHDPELHTSTPRWGGVKELLASALCDVGHVTDLSCASATGCYDIHGRRWDPEALEIAGLRAGQLPEVFPTTARLPGLRREVAAHAGLAPGLPVVLGASDGVLANVGLGAVRPGVAAVSLGTSGAIRCVVRGPLADPAGRLFCYALTDQDWVVGGAINNGGSVVRWASALFGSAISTVPEGERVEDLDTLLLEEASDIAPGSDGLVCLPYLLGERAPWWMPGMRGAYLGLRRDHGRSHLVRAAVEGVCQQLALVRDAFAPAGLEVTEVRATGGAVASPLWVETLAATLDLPVRVSGSTEGTGLGACLLGLHALGALADLDEVADLVALREPVAPEPAAAELFRRRRPMVERAAAMQAELLCDVDDLPS